MNAMDDTIAGAASGETVQDAAPKDSQSQAKGQKSNEWYIVILNPLRDWYYPISFFIVHFVIGGDNTREKNHWEMQAGRKSCPSLQDQAGLKSFTIKTIKEGGVRIG